jgi:hypothetical protein
MKKIYLLLSAMLFLSWSGNLLAQCTDVSNLVIDDVSLTSADISWTAGGTETDWNIEYGVSGFTPGTGITGTASGTPNFSASLTSNTEYEFYVQADCGGGDLSGWFGPISVFTGYCEFEGLDSDYFINNFSTTGGISNISNLTSGFSPTGYEDATSMIVSNFAGSPNINFSVDFGFETWYTFGFGIWVDWNNDLVFDFSEQVFQSSEYEGSFSGSFGIPLGTPVGSYRMRIMADYNEYQPTDPCGLAFGQGEAEDYTLEVTTPPSCLPVTGITLEGITAASVDISWTAQGSETAWNIEYGPQGFTPGSGTSGTASVTAEFTATSLTADTYYDFYVQADCGGGDESVWVGPLTAYTGFCEFEGLDSDYFIDNFSTSGGTGSNISNLGSGYGTNGYEDATAMIVSSFADGPDINFTIENGFGYYLGSSIWVDWNQNMIFEVSEQVFTSNSYNEISSGSFNVPVGTPVGTYRMRVLVDNNNSAPDDACSDAFGEVEDYTLEVLPTPTCLPIEDLTVVSVTANSADISWTAGDSETNWNIEYGPQGFTPGSGTMGTATGTPEFTAGSLTADSYYDFYVQADCGGGDESYWMGPITAYTGYCEFSTSMTDYYINNFKTTGGATSNISNMNSGIAPNGYDDATAMTVSQFEGGPNVTFTASFGFEDWYTFGLGIWVDWNNNMSFEPSEQVFQSFGYQDFFTGSFNVPAGTAVGSYRMRVLADYYNDSPTDACTLESGEGEAEDYTFVVVPIPTCMPVSDVEIDAESSTGFDISWTPGDTETTWNIEWGAPGFVPGTGTGIDSAQQTSSASYSVGGLTPSTSYDIYVQAVCSATDSSYWTLVSGTTTCAPVTALPWTEDFESMTQLDFGIYPICWASDNDEWISDDGGNTPGTANSGNNFVGIYYNSSDNLWTPQFQLTAGTKYEFSFMWAAADEYDGWSGAVVVNDMQSPVGADTLGILITPTDEPSTDYQKATFCFTPATSGVYTFGVEIDATSNPWFLSFDDFKLIERLNSAGTGGTIDACQIEGLVDLTTVAVINDTMGVWTFAADSAAIVNDTMFDPQLSTSGIVSVDYITYGCLVDTVSVLVHVYPASDAGVDSTIVACKNEPVDLFLGLAGNPDNGGDWYDPSNTLITGSVATMAPFPGSYNYRYIVGNGVCPDDTSGLVVTVLSTCDELSVDETVFESVNLYPNPSTGLVYIESDLSTEPFNLEVTDVNGRLVETGTNAITNGVNAINLGNVQRGTYFFKLSNGNAEKVYRVVIQ